MESDGAGSEDEGEGDGVESEGEGEGEVDGTGSDVVDDGRESDDEGSGLGVDGVEVGVEMSDEGGGELEEGGCGRMVGKSTTAARSGRQTSVTKDNGCTHDSSRRAKNDEWGQVINVCHLTSSCGRQTS